MATLTWFNQDNSNLSFSLEFDESYTEDDFRELVYGLIENAHGYDERKYRIDSESSKAYQEHLDRYSARNDSLKAENKVMQEQLDIALQELADAKLDNHIHLASVHNESLRNSDNGDMNNMGDEAYESTNV